MASKCFFNWLVTGDTWRVTMGKKCEHTSFILPPGPTAHDGSNPDDGQAAKLPVIKRDLGQVLRTLRGRRRDAKGTTSTMLCWFKSLNTWPLRRAKRKQHNIIITAQTGRLKDVKDTVNGLLSVLRASIPRYCEGQREEPGREVQRKPMTKQHSIFISAGEAERHSKRST